MSIRPFVAGAQREGELAAILGLVTFEDVGMELEFVVIDDQARVAVGGHQSRIARAGDEHVELTTLPARTISPANSLITKAA